MTFEEVNAKLWEVREKCQADPTYVPDYKSLNNLTDSFYKSKKDTLDCKTCTRRTECILAYSFMSDWNCSYYIKE